MDAAGRLWFRDAVHGELARTIVANPFEERGVACVAAFRNQVHTGLPSEDPCSRARPVSRQHVRDYVLAPDPAIPECVGDLGRAGGTQEDQWGVWRFVLAL